MSSSTNPYQPLESLGSGNGGKKGGNDPSTGSSSKKRAAGSPPPLIQFSVAHIREHFKKVKLLDDAAATTTASPSALQATPKLDAMDVDPKDEEDHIPLEDFKYTDIPIQSAWQNCAFGLYYDLENDVFGSFLEPMIDFDISLKIDAGRLGYPKLCLRIRVAKNPTGKPITGKTDCDILEWLWYVATPAPSTNLVQIQDFSFDSFNEWRSMNPDVTYPFLESEKLNNVRDKAWTFACVLRHPIQVQDFADQDIWKRLGKLQDTFNSIRSEEQLIRFWFVPAYKSVVDTHVPMLITRMERNLGILSQYNDLTTGEYLLNKLDTAPTIDTTGGGIFTIQKGNNAGEYYAFERKDRFDTAAELGTYTALTAIREAQFSEGKYAFLEAKSLGCFIMTIPKFVGKQYKNEKRTQEQIDMDNALLLYVRCDSGEERRMVPEAGLSVDVEWDTTSSNRAHVSDKANLLRGVIVPSTKQKLDITLTDFCVVVPFKSGQKKPLWGVHRNLRFERNLPKVFIRVQFSQEPFQRELRASIQFARSNYPPLVNIRCMLMDGGAFNPACFQTADIRLGVPEDPANVAIFETVIAGANARLKNEGHANFFKTMGAVQGNVVVLAGPPGTGKTLGLSYLIRALVAIGHKVGAFGPSNNSVDTLVTGVRKVPVVTGDALQLLRQEISSVEKNALLREALVAEVDPNEALPAWPSITAEQDPRVTVAYSEFLAEAHSQEEALNFEDEFLSYQNVYSAIQSTKKVGIKASKIAFRDTMGGHISRIMRADQEEAEASFKEAQDAAPEGTIISPTANERNRSYAYGRVHHAWIENQGNVGNDLKKQFFILRAEMEKRVFSQLDCLFTTCNNAGTQDWEALGFLPTVLIIDEAGQSSLPTSLVPLTAFNHYTTTIFAGDWRQLVPTILAKKISEVWKSSCVSPLERLEKNKVPTQFLTQQYRMAESIARFVSDFIYGGRLSTHPDAQIDNRTREIVRQVARDSYGIQVDTEVFFINVPFGVARQELDGTSLQNYANIDATQNVLDRFIAGGIDPDNIVILTLYKAQTRLMAQRIPRTGDDRRKYRQISTVDAFQGNEAPVIVFDTVSASEYALAGKDFHDKDVDSTGRVHNVSEYAMDVHRLNCANTRAMHGLAIIGQIELASRQFRKNRKPLGNFMFHWAKDLFTRGLVGHEDTLVDTHPSAAHERLRYGQAGRGQTEAGISRAQRYAFTNRFFESGQRAQVWPDRYVNSHTCASTSRSAAPPGPAAPPPPTTARGVDEMIAARHEQRRGRGGRGGRGGTGGQGGRRGN